MSMTKVTTDQIGTQKIEIFVDGSGHFHAEYNEESYNADTRVALLKQLEKAVKAGENEKAIPVTLIDLVPAGKKDYGDGKFSDGRGVVQAKLRGKHGRQWNTWLFVTEDGKTKFSLSRETDRKMCRRLTEEEIAKYEELAAAVDVAELHMTEWLATVHVTPEDLLKL